MYRYSIILMAYVLFANPISCFAQTAQLTEGTPVRLRLEQALSTKDSSAGQKLQLTVVEDVIADDQSTVLIKQGASALGYLVNVDDREGGKGGKLGIEISSAKAVDGSKVSLRGIKTKSGSGGAGVGTYVVSAILLGVIGIGLAAIFGRGRDAKIPAGTTITAFVDKDVQIAVVKEAISAQEIKLESTDGAAKTFEKQNIQEASLPLKPAL